MGGWPVPSCLLPPGRPLRSPFPTTVGHTFPASFRWPLERRAKRAVWAINEKRRYSAQSFAALLLVCVTTATAGRAAAQLCSTVACSATQCSIDPTESALRSAIQQVNDCAATPNSGYTSRYISFTNGCDLRTINMQQTSTSGAIASCALANLPEKYSVCIEAPHVTIDGAYAITFHYSGSALCANCPGSCLGETPALFTLRGSNITLKNFSLQYFPEGIQIRDGASNNTIHAVTYNHICEDALTIWSGVGNTVYISNFYGDTSGGPKQCYNAMGTTGGPPTPQPANCGRDKAIQINGGNSLILVNVFSRMSQAGNVVAGLHTLQSNNVLGDPNDDSICQTGIHIQNDGLGMPSVTLVSNNISQCKWGVRLTDQVAVEANSNDFWENYLAAFLVQEGSHASSGALLKGAGNRIKRSGYQLDSECERGAVVVRDMGTARVDFGGGDAAGSTVLGGLSAGGNIFCQETSTVPRNDIWNIVDCPCVTSGCTPPCRRGPTCCPVAPDGGGTEICTGSAGAASSAASIGARNNCFDLGPPRVATTYPAKTVTTGATVCTASQCNF